jgi:hypothetical protein
MNAVELEVPDLEVNLSPAYMETGLAVTETGLAITDLCSAIPFAGLTQKSPSGV